MFHLTKKYCVMAALLLCGVDSAFSADIDNFTNPPSEQTQSKAVHTINHAFQPQVDLSGLAILDVGSFDGCNAGEMRKRGAKVYGLDIDQNALTSAVRHGFIDADKIIFGKIETNYEARTRAAMQEHPEIDWDYEGWEKSFSDMRQIPEIGTEYHGKFDVITIFRIAFDEDEGAQKLANLLKQGGKLIIGYATHREYSEQHSNARDKLKSELFDFIEDKGDDGCSDNAMYSVFAKRN